MNEREFSFEYNFTDGSEAQRSWAGKIVSSKIDDVFTMVAQYGGEKFEKASLQGIEFCNKMAAVTSAIYWINNRDLNWKEIVKSL